MFGLMLYGLPSIERTEGEAQMIVVMGILMILFLAMLLSLAIQPDARESSYKWRFPDPQYVLIANITELMLMIYV